MKLLGITAGRPGGNSEILMKEALMAAEEEYNAETASSISMTKLSLHGLEVHHAGGHEA